MIENIIFHNPKFRDLDMPISEIRNDDERKRVAKKIQELDNKNGFAPNKKCYANSYDNDDYLFVADMLQDICELHKKIYYNPLEAAWVKGNREIPYIHLDFFEGGSFEIDENGNAIPNDQSLNMWVGKSTPTGCHTLSFNYYWLRRYLSFLQIVFDDNEDEVFEIPGLPPQKVEYKTKSELLTTVVTLKELGLQEQAECLNIYINSFSEDRVAAPILTYLNIGGKKKYVWGLWNEDGTEFRVPLKKTIYNTSGFASLFQNRSSLVSELFLNSVKMILAHETAHVARGHWLLRESEPEYSQSRNVKMNCEINADWTAVYWLINELLYDTIDGNPHSRIIAYKKNTLIYLWAVRIFSAYLSLSWFSRNENREWTVETLKEYVSNESASHPIYQFRLFCMLNKVKEQLEHMGEISERETHFLLTADNFPINKSVYDEVWRKACDMIFSFEYAFRACWNEDDRDSVKKIFDGLHVINGIEETDIEKMPFYICYMLDARRELETYECQWSEILEKLRAHGMYYRM